MKRIVAILFVLFLMLNTCAYADMRLFDPNEFGEQLTDVTAEDFHGVWDYTYILAQGFVFGAGDLGDPLLTLVIDNGLAIVTYYDSETGEPGESFAFEVVFADGAYTGEWNQAINIFHLYSEGYMTWETSGLGYEISTYYLVKAE